MKKIITTIFLSLFFVLVMTSTTLAQSPTPTGLDITSDKEASAETTQKLKERIEKIVEEKKQQIQGAISDLSHKKRGFIGEIQRVTEETLTIKNKKGTQIIPLDNGLKLIKKNATITTEDIAVGDWVVILGLVENDNFIPKQINISNTSLQPRSHIVMLGTIQEISSKSLTFKSRAQENGQDFKINTKTNFQDNEGKKALMKDFSENMQALLIGYEDEDKKIVTVLRALATFEKK